MYSLPDIIRAMKSRRMGSAMRDARMWKMNAFEYLVGKSEGKRPLRDWDIDRV
jgi:hypothetical protein